MTGLDGSKGEAVQAALNAFHTIKVQGYLAQKKQPVQGYLAHKKQPPPRNLQ